MNRRNIIRAMIASATLPALPALPAAAKDAETLKRDAFRALLAVDDRTASKLNLLRIGTNEGHYCRSLTLELFESGMPMDEVMQRIDDRVHYNCYGPKGPPVYDERGNKIGGGSLDWRESADAA